MTSLFNPRKLSGLLVLVASLMTSFSARAYLLASPGNDPIDYRANTVIIIAGRGKELQRQFQDSALSQANRYRQLGGQQVVLVFAREYKSESDLRYVESRGFRVSEHNTKTFTAKALFNVLERFNSIGAIHVFSHHGAHVGAGLEGGEHRFHHNTPGAADLRDNFTSGAFVVFHGCNSGFYTAPKLAQAWGIPVAGSFTSTDFQQLHSNGKYYFNNPGQAPSGGWAGCPGGVCRRMKADNQPYRGMWGSFDGGGLPFFKFFCTGSCDRGMANYVRSFVTNETDPTNIVKDIMCPNDASGKLRAQCFAALDSGNETYTPFSGRSLQCDMQSCSFEFKCKYSSSGRPIEGTCSLRNTAGSSTTTFVSEYRRLLRAAGGSMRPASRVRNPVDFLSDLFRR